MVQGKSCCDIFSLICRWNLWWNFFIFLFMSSFKSQLCIFTGNPHKRADFILGKSWILNLTLTWDSHSDSYSERRFVKLVERKRTSTPFLPFVLPFFSVPCSYTVKPVSKASLPQPLSREANLLPLKWNNTKALDVSLIFLYSLFVFRVPVRGW
jgi:hypothetical protein